MVYSKPEDVFMININSLDSEQKQLRKRIIELSFKHRLSHIGSCLTSIDLINVIFKIKNKNEKFVLSNGHAGVALYVVLEKNKLISPSFFKNISIHPHRDFKNNISVSTGSLGQGLPIALGIAFANKKEDVYCMISDGECMEGSIWESIRIAIDKKIYNLKIVVNANGWGAYDPIDIPILIKRLKAFGCLVKIINGNNPSGIIKTFKQKADNKLNVIFAKTDVGKIPFLKGQNGHYHVINKKEYQEVLKILE